MSEVDLFGAAEDAYRYSEAIRAGDTPSNAVSFEHTVVVICDSAAKPVRWYSLAAKHGQRKKTRVRCYKCGRMATMEDAHVGLQAGLQRGAQPHLQARRRRRRARRGPGRIVSSVAARRPQAGRGDVHAGVRIGADDLPLLRPELSEGVMSTLFRHQMGAELRRIRRQKGLTLWDVSALAHVSPSHLSEVEIGKNEVSSEILEAICNALEVVPRVSLHQRKMQLVR